MLKIMRIMKEYEVDNVGCNNGVLQPMEIHVLDTDTASTGIYHTMTCGCWRGCGISSRMPAVGDRFINFEDFEDFLDS